MAIEQMEVEVDTRVGTFTGADVAVHEMVMDVVATIRNTDKRQWSKIPNKSQK